MDVHPTILQLPLPPLRHLLSHGHTVLDLRGYPERVARQVQAARETYSTGLRVSAWKRGISYVHMLMSRSKIAPTAMSTVGDIGLSNMSLKVITLSLYSEYPLLSPRLYPHASHGKVFRAALCPPLRLSLPRRKVLAPPARRRPAHHVRGVPHGVQHHIGLGARPHHGLLGIRSFRSPMGVDRTRHAPEIHGAEQPIRDDILARPIHGSVCRGRQHDCRGLVHDL